MLYLTWVEMVHHALAPGTLSLLVGGAMAQVGMDVEERECGGLRGKGLKAPTRSITIGKGGVF